MPVRLDPALRLSTFFGALFLIYGTSLTYLPVWLDGRGLSAAEIAVVSSAPMIVRLGLTPWLAFLADRSTLHRELIIGACAIALATLLALERAWSPPFLILLVVIALIAVQTVMPLIDTIAMASVKANGLDYGRIRLWGSLTFILASYAAGFAVARQGAEAVLHLLIAAAALAAAASVLLPCRPRGATHNASKLTIADAIALARDRSFVLFAFTTGTIGASHAVLYVFGVLHWRAQGLSAAYIATLWAIGVLAEIVLFWAARWLTPVGSVGLLLIGAVSGIVRWLAMAADPSPLLLVPLQILHAGTFAASHLGAMHWIAHNVPPQTAGTAQALVSTFNSGIAMSGATLLAGLLYPDWAGRSYLAMAALCALGLAAGLLLRRSERTHVAQG